MPFEPEIPTLASLVQRSIADIDVALGIETALLDTQPEFVLATNNATMAHGGYLSLRRVARNVVPGVDNDEDALAQHARLWLGNDDGKRPASPASLTLVGTGTTATVIPAGTVWRRTSDSALYATTEELVFETDPVVVTALAESEDEAGWGASGNALPGATMTLVSEVVGLDAEWTVDGTPGVLAGNGSDEETHSELAGRVVFRAQNPPRGGTLEDYEAWAREVPGVGQAWAYKGLAGPGTINVYFTRNDPDNLVPDATLIAAVQAYLDTVAPAQAGVVQAGAISLLNVTVTVAIKPNTTAVQAAVTTALREAFALRGFAGDGTLYFDRSWITEALSLAVGEEGHTLTLPAADVAVGMGRLPRLATPVNFSTKA